jgi:hypothetical protein
MKLSTNPLIFVKQAETITVSGFKYTVGDDFWLDNKHYLILNITTVNQKTKIARLMDNQGNKIEKEFSTSEDNIGSNSNEIIKLNAQQKNIVTAAKFIKKCSWCGKIISEQEINNSNNSSNSDNNKNKISHGICEECAKKHFPEHIFPLKK